jgi:3-oxoacyl-[acyl-carrier protein] reductase
MITPIALIHATAYGMMERGFGRIVNVTSVSVKAPIPNLELSNGARAGLTGAVAVLARKAVAHGVTINNMLPGPFDTDRIRATSAKAAAESGRSIEDINAERQAQLPARRFGRPDEFGAAAAFLCSVHAGFITGQNIVLDGGMYNGSV